MTSYYVAYSWARKVTSGFGNIDIQAGSDKLSLELIKAIKAEIIRQNGGDISITILNIIKMEA